MAHSPVGLKKLDRLTAAIMDLKPAEFRDAYMKGFMEIMALKTTRGKHATVLVKMAGYLSDHLSAEERKRVRAAIGNFRRGQAPLIVPMTLLNHYIEMHEVTGVDHQTYLNLHPGELMLRNRV